MNWEGVNTLKFNKITSSFIIGVLSLSLLSISSFADSNQAIEPEKIIKVDSITKEVREARLIADYDADYLDLLDQFKLADSDYQHLLSEAKIYPENSLKGEEIAEKLASLERDFDGAVESMLKDRYTDDKKSIRPEIIKKVESANSYDQDFDSSLIDAGILSTSIRIGTFTQMHTGNYGYTDRNNWIGNITSANYNHAYQNNVSTLQAFGSAFVARAEVESGINASIYANPGDPSSRMGEMRFYNQTFNATLITTGSVNTAHANFNIRNLVYNVTTNQLLSSYTFFSQSVTTPGQYEVIDVGPLFIYMYNINFIAGHQYRAYVRSFAEGIAQGNATATGSGNGLVWETIDVYFN